MLKLIGGMSDYWQNQFKWKMHSVCVRLTGSNARSVKVNREQKNVLLSRKRGRKVIR